jgi:hypothetical protein
MSHKGSPVQGINTIYPNGHHYKLDSHRAKL